MTTTVVRAACPHDCPDTCAMLVTVEDGVATEVQGDPDHPTTAGVLCTKVARYTERTYHPERLLYPMRRVGAKGEGKFERISWDEALDTIAARLKAIAAREPQAILPYSYAGTMGLVQGDVDVGALLPPARRVAARPHHLRDRPARPAITYTLGGTIGTDIEQFQDAKLILIWGGNPIASQPAFLDARPGSQAARRAA